MLDRAMERYEREHSHRHQAGVAHPVVAERDCRTCGEPIDPRRLAVMPTAQLCTGCKAIGETGGTRG